MATSTLAVAMKFHLLFRSQEWRCSLHLPCCLCEVVDGVYLDPKGYLFPDDTLKQRKTTHSSFLKAQATETGIVLPENCIRHTTASFMAESQGYTETANQLGHDIGMLLKHYRRAITKTEAEAFYNITPDSV